MSSALSSNGSAVKTHIQRNETGKAGVTERETIIRRWARLKQASKAMRAIDPVSDRAVATAVPSEAAAADDAPFDLASLPSIESIAADTDIVGFLRSEVPAELTRAALRRAWTSDPAIRDFIGIAENQWDFNDPDAIPGFGPLTPMEDSASALAQISSRLEATIGELTSSGGPANLPTTQSSLPIAEVRTTDSVERDSPKQIPAAASARAENGLLEERHVQGTHNRHGGALPR